MARNTRKRPASAAPPRPVAPPQPQLATPPEPADPPQPPAHGNSVSGEEGGGACGHSRHTSANLF